MEKLMLTVSSYRLKAEEVSPTRTTHHHSKLRYQPEIDGLRTIAITAAVFYHAGIPGFSGGYIGVDIFFVISGFLITRMLLAEMMHTGKIEFFAFYARRVRRLLPALIVVILSVLLLGTLVLSPAGEQQDLSNSAAATVAFLSNVYFWRTQDPYLAAFSNEWVPLLHAWTLSVEEQFYILWPAMLVVGAWFCHKIRASLSTVMTLLLAALLVASFSLSWWGTFAKPVATFYLMPTRGWEFVLGAMLAVTAKPLITRIRYVAAPMIAIGLAAIVVAIATLDEDVPYPGVAALVPTVSTAAVLIGTLAVPQPGIIRLLQTAPMVAVGKLSYSWYLWHWPLLVLVRIHELGGKNLFRDALVIIGSLGLAAVTYLFWENPIRRQKFWPFSDVGKTLASGLVMSCAIAGIALALYFRADALASRDPNLAAIYAARSKQIGLPRECHSFGRFTGLAPADKCLVGAVGQLKRVLVWGDSHAERFLPMISEHGHEHNYSAIARTQAGCPPLVKPPSADAVFDRDCEEFNAAVAKEIPGLAQIGLKGVVLASQYFDFNGEYLRETLSIAQNFGLKVLVIAPVPFFFLPVPLCLSHHTRDDCSADRILLDRAREPLLHALRQIVPEFKNARIWDPFDVLCNEQVCAPAHAGLVLYSDENHLSIDGSRSLVTFAAPELNWLISNE
jgi:peptidoglycan/LPS O-acetylase OafA/YrhL